MRGMGEDIMRSIVASRFIATFVLTAQTALYAPALYAQTSEPAPAPAPALPPAQPAPAEPSYVVPPPSPLLEVQPSATANREQLVNDDYSSYESSRDGTLKGRFSGFLAYDFAIPLGSMRDFAANVSPLGLELQFRGWVLSNLSLGVNGEWSTFLDDRERTTYDVDNGNGAVTASAYNYLVTSNVRFLAHYYFEDSGMFRPYFGPHVGFGWSSFESEAADLVLSDTQFSIAFGGDLGAIIVPSGGDPLILANVRFAAQPASEFIGIVDDVQTISLQVGVGL